ncbi:hypothetical protein [Streptomyces longwoodensis]|uniref:hypothetical protein n=1 Tax=Streptomyces longwoodensis TaxID=68231 RepID=UPI00384AD51D
MDEEEITEIQSLVGEGSQGWTYRFVNGEEGVDLTCTNIPGDWIYRAEGRLLNGRPAITSISILPRDPRKPQPITKEVVRRTPIGTVLAKVKSALRAEWERRVKQVAAISRTHIKAGRSWSADHYRHVAWFCIEAELRGVGPRQVIADHWGVNKSTASRWMAEARRRGYLPEYPVSPRKSESFYSSWIEAQQQVDEQIFCRVLAEKVTAANSPAGGDSDTLAQSLVSMLFGPSEASQRVRTSIFAEHLLHITRTHPEKHVREAAQSLVAALNDQSKSNGKAAPITP